MKYVVITPARNEAEYIELTIHSMIRQTLRPAEWIIVNDGSTDETGDIVARYAAQHSWIKLVNRDDRGDRQRGKGVIETFYAGYETIIRQDYDAIVKLDGDVSFDPPYFESLAQKFRENPKLGITGGGVYEKRDGEHWSLYSYREQVRGPTKVYRQACFEEIGGLAPSLGWDRVDEWKALSLGWEVHSFPELKVYHYRLTGAATGLLKSRVENGYESHYMAYHPLYLIARGVRSMFKPPYLVGGLAMIATYFWAGIKGQERLSDPALVRYIRRTQLRKLFGLLAGKPVHE